MKKRINKALSNMWPRLEELGFDRAVFEVELDRMVNKGFISVKNMEYELPTQGECYASEHIQKMSEFKSGGTDRHIIRCRFCNEIYRIYLGRQNS